MKHSSKTNRQKPLVDKKYVMEKFPVKGGWTFVRIPEVASGSSPFGWVKVKGSIDGYEIRKYHLMPMGNGKLFLPVRAEIRKKIKKSVGDSVHVILYPDDEPLEVPKEMMICLRDEPAAFKFFNSLSEGEQKYYIDWIYSAKKVDTKISRLAATVNRCLKRLKRNEKEGDDRGF